MRFHKRSTRSIAILLACLLLTSLTHSQSGDHADTAGVDTAAAVAPITLVQPAKIIEPGLSERGVILGAALVMLAGFVLLIRLKKREADERAGLD